MHNSCEAIHVDFNGLLSTVNHLEDLSTPCALWSKVQDCTSLHSMPVTAHTVKSPKSLHSKRRCMIRIDSF